jgi:hypothetical protein
MIAAIDPSTQDFIVQNLKKYSPDGIAEMLVHTYRASSLEQAQQIVAEVVAAQQAPALVAEPNTQTQFDGALHVAAKGVPQIPLRPRTKIAFQNNWDQLATTDPAQLNAWHAQYPDSNWAGVALAQSNGIWIFEIDNVDAIRQRLGAIKLPRTFMVRSRPGRGHYYFRHNAASISLAQLRDFISIKVDGKEAASARLNHAYCVTAFSTHPETGKPYEIVSDVDLAEAPQDLIEWIKARHADGDKLPLTARLDGPKIPRGSHDNELTRIAGKLRQDGMEEDSIADALIEICEKRCEDYGSDYKEMCQKIAHSIGKKPIVDTRVLHNGVPVDVIAQEIARQKQANAAAQPVIDDLPPIVEEPMPEFPEMSGALWNLAKEMYPDIPMSFKFMSLVAHWGLVRSGLDVLAGQRNFQTRFYICLVSDPWRGKTAAMNEAHNYLRAIYSPTVLQADGVDSGPALCDDFEDLRKAYPTADRVMILLHADEMVDLFEKSKSTSQSRNTLGTALLSLYESNSIANRARQANKGKRIQVENAHLAILGGTTREGYESMWLKTGGGANGLQSRFIPIGTTSGPMPVSPRESTADAAMWLQDIINLAQKPKQTIYLEPEAEKVLTDWWTPYRRTENPSTTRVLDMVRRMILVLGVTNPGEADDVLGDDNHVAVGPELVRQACAFGDYVIAMRERLNPMDSYTYVQAFENGIIRTFERHSDRPLTERDVMTLLNVYHKPGGLGSFGQAWKNCLAHDVMTQVGYNRKGKPAYQKAA